MINRLFPIVDEGLITLPAEVTAAREALRALDAAAASLTPPDRPENVMRALVPEVAATGTVKALDAAAARLMAARDAVAQHEDRRHLVTSARSLAASRLDQVVKKRRDQIISDHLAPVVATVVDEARTLVAKFRPHGTIDAALLMAPMPARDAWVAFAEVVRNYGALLGARSSLLWGHESDLLDGHGLFAEVKNTEEVRPQYVRLAGSWQQREAPPWADPEPAARLLKLLSAEAVIWCPTLAHAERAVA